ncbi:MAG: chemotaxis protein CheX [Zetaproteobacteria bacterium]|nr:chemotaxis protein CheX [Zetaproteobacteria bacterium]
MSAPIVEESEARGWLDLTVMAVRDFAEQALFTDNFKIGEIKKDARIEGNDTLGSYISVLGDGYGFEAGLLANKENTRKLCAMFLGMVGEEEELSDDDVLDAFGEISNIVCGMVKVRMSDADPSMHIGLPLFVQGTLICMSQQLIMRCELYIDDVLVNVMLVWPGRQDIQLLNMHGDIAHNK